MRIVLFISFAFAACHAKPSAVSPEAVRPQQGRIHGESGLHRFERADEWVDRFDAPERDRWQKPNDVIKLVGVRQRMVVADIGAGTGYFLPYLSRAVGPEGVVLGLDVEPDMVRHMRERAKHQKLANVTARAVLSDDPALPGHSIDRILIVNTWHHIRDRRAYTRKLATALRPEGAIAIVDYTLESPYGPPRHERLEPQTVVAELETGGLAGRVVDESLPHQYIVIAVARSQ